MGGLKKSEGSKFLDVLAGVAAKEVKKNGKFLIPGVCQVDSSKASHQGRQEVDVWQDGGCQGAGGENCCKGLSSGSSQESRLICPECGCTQESILNALAVLCGVPARACQIVELSDCM